jgi:hypothetical protein
MLAQTPAGLAEIASDDFPILVFHEAALRRNSVWRKRRFVTKM